MIMKNDEILFTKLIEETLKEEVEKPEATMHDLATYFENRLNQVEYLSLKKYLDTEGLKYFSLTFNADSKCYRLCFEDKEIDFPSNWSIFEKISLRPITHVDHENDEDSLCDIFQELFETCESFMITNDKNDFKMIIFSEANVKEHVQWFTEYFDKQKSENSEIAA
jgi:hypothetical protein